MKTLATDLNNNQLMYDNKKLLLKLKGHIREIAHITGKKDDWTLVLKRNRKLHKMKVNDSYGFCYDMLIKCREVGITKVKIMDEKEQFNVSLEYLIDKGEFLHFLKQGFEKQIFVTLKDLNNGT